MSKAKQQRNASYAAGYFDGYSGNCYCIGIGGSLYHRGYVKGSSDAAKRTAKYRVPICIMVNWFSVLPSALFYGTYSGIDGMHVFNYDNRVYK
ncbi:hypothetical protein [Xenorhabdus bovienii]|nr:hypothetical protein [Xenorhabdus bovienii]